MPRKKKASDRKSYWCVDLMSNDGVTLGFKCSKCSHGWQEGTTVQPDQVDRKATPNVTCPDCGVTDEYCYLPAQQRWGR